MRFQFPLQQRLPVLALLFATLAALSFLNADGARSQTAPAMLKEPAVQNVWLMRQTEKILPPTCLAGSDIGAFSEVLSGEVVGQALGAFSFEIEYDRHVACIVATPGDEFASAGVTCTVEDSITAWWLRGIARVSCATAGKGLDIDELSPLAQLEVRPQPDVYSAIKPNQDNHVLLEVDNVNCDLTDEQGAPIAVASCENAFITFRYLEGDVEPDCVIDAMDTQIVAFRWGVNSSSSLYRDFANVQPSGLQSDNDIDTNDLQFVFGRFGSTCDDPHPPQPPVDPTA